MMRPLKIFSLFVFCAGTLAGCGNQEAPGQRPPAEVPGNPPGGKVCSEPLKTCPGGAIPTVDAATCKQTCPGE